MDGNEKNDQTRLFCVLGSVQGGRPALVVRERFRAMCRKRYEEAQELSELSALCGDLRLCVQCPAGPTQGDGFEFENVRVVESVDEVVQLKQQETGRNRVGVKQCGRCGVVKPVSEFHRDRTRRDGCYPICRPCRSKARSARRAARQHAKQLLQAAGTCTLTLPRTGALAEVRRGVRVVLRCEEVQDAQARFRIVGLDETELVHACGRNGASH